jgi:hypothetical protein
MLRERHIVASSCLRRHQAFACPPCSKRLELSQVESECIGPCTALVDGEGSERVAMALAEAYGREHNGAQ